VKGDFSRFVVDPDQYSRVFMQQGRVMVDSDWNELVAIVTGAQRQFAADVIGPHGGPSAELAYHVELVQGGNQPDLGLSAGTYYIDGIRVVNMPSADGSDPLYSAQPYLTDADKKAFPNAPYLIYLDVWERHVAALEDDSIREVALGGPDTTSRAEVMAQVKVLHLAEAGQYGTSCASFDLTTFVSDLVGQPPRLKVRARRPSTIADDPCVSSPDAQYRGPENQLYRVEIHAVDGEAATFVWSRENGSVVAAWLATDGDDLQVTGVRDKIHGFQAGDWVELTHDLLELRNEHGVLVRLASVEGDVLTMDPSTATGTIEADPTKRGHAKVRRWDQRERTGLALTDGAVPVTIAAGAAGWIALEDGIEVQFQPAPAGTTDTYRVGDHWVFPARVATGDVQWPQATDGSGPLALVPHGVEHHYAPLALVRAAGAGPVDLRHSFDALAACVKNQ
jgi:hypothetical protein